MYALDIVHENLGLQEKLQQLYTLNRNKTIDLGFRPPYLNLLKAFGNPHLNIPPVVHVAGTNGKGSTIAIMRSILEAAGYKAHVYTSPHLIRFNERIVLAGSCIEDDELEDLIDEALALNKGQDVTFFEITTALAFAAFSRTPADIVLLETGLGGRLDCTNVIEHPLVSVITNIGYDHMEFLGEALSDIAREKAGIIKQNVPCVFGHSDNNEKNQDIFLVIDQISLEKHSDLYRNGREWFVSGDVDHIKFNFKSDQSVYECPALVGRHQICNVGGALAALKIILQNGAFVISDDAIDQGLKNARWPARLQKLDHGMPQGWTLWLDGGHNADAGQVLAHQAKQWKDQGSGSVHLVLGMMAHKDVKGFLAPLLPHLSSITCVNIPGEPKSLKFDDVRLQIGKVSIPVYAQSDWQDAVSGICEGEAGHILIAGSLYLAGRVLQDIG